MSDSQVSPPWTPVLMYHRVVPSIDGADVARLSVTSRQLERQLRYFLRHGYAIVPLEETLTRAPGAATSSRSRKAVALTFDDGYQDFFLHALPVLQQLGAPATVFLVSGRTGGVNDWDSGRVAPAPLMSASEIRQAQAAGVTFGSHSVTHPHLARFGEAEARREIVESKKDLEQLLQAEVRLFCYPYGSSTPALESEVADAGYAAAWGIEQRRHTRFNISRIDAVRAASPAVRWWFHVSGTYFRVRRRTPRLRRMLRGRTRRQ